MRLKHTRRTLLAGVAAMLCVTTVPAVAQEGLRIAAVVQSLDTEFNVLWADAIQAHPLVADGTVELNVFDGRMDPYNQATQIDTAISQGYDAIIFIPVDINAGNDPVERAEEAGVPVIGSNTLISETDLYTSYIASNDVDAGHILARSVAERIGGEGEVFVIEGMIGQSAQVQRGQGIAEELENHPGITVSETQTANWSRAEALSLVENWLISHGGEVDGIIAHNDEMALGAMEAVRAYGIDPATMPIAGVDGITDALLAAKRGEVMSTLQDANAQAQGAMDLAIAAAMGDQAGSYTPKADVWTVNGGALEWSGTEQQHYTVPWVPVTAENVDDLLELRG
jgi:ABC-type sugar transport system substrate-binding protein